jgi:hypothetical protein
MPSTYPTAGFELPLIEGHRWEFHDSPGNDRESISMRVINERTGEMTFATYAEPSRKAIEKSARLAALNWAAWQQIKGELTLPQVRDEKWAFDPLSVAQGLIRVKLGDILSYQGQESDLVKLDKRLLQRAIDKMAAKREGYHRFIEQDFDLPPLADGDQWEVKFSGGPLPYVAVSIKGRYRAEVAQFKVRSVQEAALKLAPVISHNRNHEFFAQVEREEA